MNRQKFFEQAMTVVFLGVIACLFIVQAKVGLDSGGVPRFSLEHMNLAFGYGHSSAAGICGNGTKTSDEGCDDAGTAAGDGCSATCAVESGWSCTGTAPTSCGQVCGNGVKTTGEGCDDGNTSNGDGCSSSCTVQSGWSCTGTPSTCSTTCGDGIAAGSEACDDGNIDNTDACKNTCVYASCGDGVIQPDGAAPGTADNEACDDAGESATCDDDCTAVACGDQRINEAAGEQCDDGNSANTDACLNSCITASCGDSYLRAGIETCEPAGTGTCGGSCTEARGIGSTTERAVAPVIKKGISRPHCGNGIFEPLKGEVCDLGRFNGLSPLCDRSCNTTFCGDGVVQAGDEECEPDRATDGSFTASLCGGRMCTVPVCNEDGTCIGGCSWVFLPACLAVQKTIVPLLQSTEVTSSTEEMAGMYGGFFPVFKEEDEALLPDQVADSSPAMVTAAASSPVATTVTPSSLSSVSGPVAGFSQESILQRCGNGIREESEDCDDGSARNSDVLPDSCRLDCTAAKCGDRVVDYREECDDGNGISGDGCTPSCTFSVCGNGVLEQGEECDDGLLNSDTKPDTCRARCILPICGDGVRDASFGEQCDQGPDNSNTIADRCRLNCTVPHCGDGVKDAKEQCDDGNASNFDACPNTCRAVNCGNGILDWNEACDDRNLLSGDGCSSSCRADSESIFQWLRSAVWLPFGR